MNDILLRRALEAKVRAVEPSDEMLMNIHREAKRRKKEEQEMNYTLKKVIAVAAAVCLICASCFAAMEINSMVSSTGADITEYAGLKAAAEEIGIKAKYVEAFENGFVFCRGGISESYSQDAEGNTVGEEYRGLSIGYQNDAGDSLMLHVRPAAGADAAGQGGASGYSCDTYKFVPQDYEPTEEDRAMEAEGDFFISYGNEMVEINKVENYAWKDGDNYYAFVAFDCNFGEEGMKQMAQEIMGK